MSGILRRFRSNPPMDTPERQELNEKRNQKATKFAWLARFLGMRPSPRALQDKGILKDAPPEPDQTFFGVSISSIYKEEDNLHENIPIPLYETAKALQPYLTVEGLFRVSGIFSEMNRLKKVFEDKEDPDFANVSSIHSISGLLELWFRELPEPITTHALYDDFMACIGDEIPEEQSVANISKLTAQLSEQNQLVLSFFLKLMSKVAENEGENKMGTKNLGVVFGSILLGGAVLCFSLGLKTTLERQNKVVQLMIENHETVLPDQSFELFADW